MEHRPVFSLTLHVHGCALKRSCIIVTAHILAYSTHGHATIPLDNATLAFWAFFLCPILFTFSAAFIFWLDLMPSCRAGHRLGDITVSHSVRKHQQQKNQLLQFKLASPAAVDHQVLQRQPPGMEGGERVILPPLDGKNKPQASPFLSAASG